MIGRTQIIYRNDRFRIDIITPAERVNCVAFADLDNAAVGGGVIRRLIIRRLHAGIVFT